MISVQVHWQNKTWRWLFARPWREGSQSWALEQNSQGLATKQPEPWRTAKTPQNWPVYPSSRHLSTWPRFHDNYQRKLKEQMAQKGFGNTLTIYYLPANENLIKTKKSATGCCFVIRTHSSMYVKLPQAGRHSTPSLGIRLQDRTKKFVFIECVCRSLWDKPYSFWQIRKTRFIARICLVTQAQLVENSYLDLSKGHAEITIPYHAHVQACVWSHWMALDVSFSSSSCIFTCVLTELSPQSPFFFLFLPLFCNSLVGCLSWV